MTLSYRSTIAAGFIGYFTQAITINFAPLLFVMLQEQYALSLTEISGLIAVCFFAQMAVDAAAAKFSGKFHPRRATVLAHILAAAGIAGLGILPELLPPYVGLVIAVLLSGTGSGFIEVMISPIVEACPTKRKSAYMSLLHSFYCWGQAGVALLSTLWFATLGMENWKYLACLWALVPLVGGLLFCFVPLYPMGDEAQKEKGGSYLKNKMFWTIVVMMFCSGAAEIAMSQWASAFAESALGVDKTMGDLLGPCAFAILMGTARIAYAAFSKKIRMRNFMAICSCLCIFSYLLAGLAESPILALMGCALCGLSVGIMWPGNISNAAAILPHSGVSMFAFLALAGDIGCLIGPTAAGKAADICGGNIRVGFLVSIIFPLLLLLALAYLSHCKRTEKKEKSAAPKAAQK